MQISECCEEYLKGLAPNYPRPPVECNACAKQLTYDRDRMESAFEDDTGATHNWRNEGFTISNVQYTSSQS